MQLDKLEKFCKLVRFRRKQHPVEAEAEGNDADKVQESRASVTSREETTTKTRLYRSRFRCLMPIITCFSLMDNICLYIRHIGAATY